MSQIQKQAELHQSLQNANTPKSTPKLISNLTPKTSKSLKHLEDKLVEQEYQTDQEEEENYDFSVLYFAFFAIYLGRTLILPLLPFYGNAIWKESRGVDDPLPDDKQGLLAALFYISYAISGISFGPLSMRIGRRSVLLICVIGITIGFIGQALSWNYSTLVTTRTFAGFFAAINGVCQSYISDVCKPHHVPKYTARLGTVFGLVFGLGPLCGGIVAKFNKLILNNVYGNDGYNETLIYQTSLFVGSMITGIASFVVFFKLKESLPENLRIPWSETEKQAVTANNEENKIINHESTTIQENSTTMEHHNNDYHRFIEVLSVSPHPDYDDVSKLILNFFDLEQNKLIKQCRFNMKQYENPEQVANEIIDYCNLNRNYKDYIISSLNESRYAIDTIPENKAITPKDDNINTTILNINNDKTGQEDYKCDFERDIDFIDYDEYIKNNENDEQQGDGIDFAALFEACLPERERTPQFKKRLKIYMLIVLFITFIMDIATAGHATIFTLLNNGKNKAGLKWDDNMVFSVAWMFYGVSYSLIQYFYVGLQKKYGAFGTGAIGCFIKIVGCCLIPWLTMFCKYYLCLSGDDYSTQWIELMIHFPASVLNGIGYGLCNTTTQTVISDYAKRYNIRSVGNWLGGWMGSVAMGAAGVILLGFISKQTTPIHAFYICAILAFIAFILFCILSYVAQDIKIIVDVKQVIQENEKLAEKLDKLAFDEYVEKSVSRVSVLDITRLSTISQLSHRLSSKTSSLSPPIEPLTPNLQVMQVMKTQKLRNSSNITSDDRMTTCGSLIRNVTDSITRTSLTQSISSFNVSTPIGPLPIITPSALLGLPMLSSSKIIEKQRQKHIDLKNIEINIDQQQQQQQDMKALNLNQIQ